VRAAIAILCVVFLYWLFFAGNGEDGVSHATDGIDSTHTASQFQGNMSDEGGTNSVEYDTDTSIEFGEEYVASAGDHSAAGSEGQDNEHNLTNTTNGDTNVVEPYTDTNGNDKSVPEDRQAVTAAKNDTITSEEEPDQISKMEAEERNQVKTLEISLSECKQEVEEQNRKLEETRALVAAIEENVELKRKLDELLGAPEQKQEEQALVGAHDTSDSNAGTKAITSVGDENA